MPNSKSQVPIQKLVNIVYDFCELYGNRHLFPYQEQFARRLIRSVLLNDGAEITALFSRQSGKCFAKDTEILMFDGTVKKVQDVKVSDCVMRPNGFPAQVLSLGRGREEMFEVRSREKNHESFTVNKSHILSVINRKGKVHNISVSDYLKLPTWKRNDEYRGYRVAVDYPEKFIPVDPYFLGLWVGDGSSRDSRITNVDGEVIRYLYQYAEEIGLRVSRYVTKNRITDFAITNGNIGGANGGAINPIVNYLKSQGMIGNKHIPDDIMLNSRNVRLEFLAGLIDSDGHHSKCGGKENTLELTSKDKVLAIQYVRLLRSLGYRASMKEHTTNCAGKKFNSFRVNAYGDFSVVPIKIERKKYTKTVLRENPLTFGFDLIPKGIDDYYGFTIDSEDHLFLLGDYTVVHNTETVALVVGGLMIILPALANRPMFANDSRLAPYKKGIMIGIYAPTLRQAQINYNRMRSFLTSDSALEVLEDQDFRLTFDTNNGNTVRLSNGSYASAVSASDGSNIEGESHHLIICEEAQDISDMKITKCLAEDTLILLADGLQKTIKQIVEDKCDKLVCYEDNMQVVGARVPFEFYDNGVQPVYEIILDSGQKIEATYNHKFYTYNQKTRGKKCDFRTVKQIIKSLNNDRPLRIAVPDSLPFFAEENSLDYEKGLLIGYFIGDGCLRNCIQFIGTEQTVNRVYSLIENVFGSFTNLPRIVDRSGGMKELRLYVDSTYQSFKNYLIELNLWNERGENKCLPDIQFSRSFYKGLIEGLIETDGCIESYSSMPLISYASISGKMILQLKDILLKFGIHSTIHVRNNSKGFGKLNSEINILHIKSSLDICRFCENFQLYDKEDKKLSAFEVARRKTSRNVSKYYSGNFRFSKVKSIKYVGEKPTYCVNMDKNFNGVHNIIANGIVSGQSIHPMGAAYNATMVLVGTATTFVAYFYRTIQRNIEEMKLRGIGTPKAGSLDRLHFEYDCDTASKYNPRYKRYVDGERKKLGEKSDAFQMSYKLKWIISRGMLVDIAQFERDNTEKYQDIVDYDMLATHVIGIDIGGAEGGDSTVLTAVEVNWDMPVVREKKFNEELGEEVEYVAYNTYIKAWLELQNMPDYEEQYYVIKDFISQFNTVRVVVDATREKGLSDRLAATLSCEVVPYVFTAKSKSDLYSKFIGELSTARARVPFGQKTLQTTECQKFLQQLGDMQKSYRGSYVVCSHSDARNAHDDYVDSWALAVWGASYEGETARVESHDKRSILKEFTNRNFQRKINALTARRRRR